MFYNHNSQLSLKKRPHGTTRQIRIGAMRSNSRPSPNCNVMIPQPLSACSESFHSAMLCISADYAVARCPSECPPICPTHAGIVLKRLNMSSNFFTDW